MVSNPNINVRLESLLVTQVCGTINCSSLIITVIFCIQCVIWIISLLNWWRFRLYFNFCNNYFGANLSLIKLFVALVSNIACICTIKSLNFSFTGKIIRLLLCIIFASSFGKYGL